MADNQDPPSAVPQNMAQPSDGQQADNGSSGPANDDRRSKENRFNKNKKRARKGANRERGRSEYE